MEIVVYVAELSWSLQRSLSYRSCLCNTFLSAMAGLAVSMGFTSLARAHEQRGSRLRCFTCRIETHNTEYIIMNERL